MYKETSLFLLVAVFFHFFGEICTDIDFVEKGYEVVHVNRHTTINMIGVNKKNFITLYIIIFMVLIIPIA